VLCSIVGKIIGTGAKETADALISALVTWAADTASWVLSKVGQFINTSSSPPLQGSSFENIFKAMVAVGAATILPFFLIGIIKGLITQSGAIFIRQLIIQLPFCIIATFGSIEIVEALLNIVDNLSSYVVKSSGFNLNNFFTQIGTGILKYNITGTIPSGAVFLFAFIILIGAFILWLELIIRSAAIEITVLFLPLFFAMGIWPTLWVYTRRLIEIISALIFSKFAVISVLALAASQMGLGAAPTSVSGVIMATALIWLAVFMPYAILKLLPSFEAGISTGIEYYSQRIKSRAKSIGSEIALQAASGETLDTEFSQGHESQIPAFTPEPLYEPSPEEVLKEFESFDLSKLAAYDNDSAKNSE
jgi:type IV secretion system protein TrbL